MTFDHLRTKALLAVEASMSPEERQAFLDSVYDLNPHCRGAAVADMLDQLDACDANLDVTEDSGYSALYDASEALWGDSSDRPGIGSLVASLSLLALFYARQAPPKLGPALALSAKAIKVLQEGA